MLDLTAAAWAVLAFSALSVGLSKTGVPGLMILAAPLLAGSMDAKQSVGLLLPLLILGDLFAVGHHRQHTQWRHLLPLLPWALGGIVVGYLVLRRVDSGPLAPAIGGAVLAMVAIMAWREVREARAKDDRGLSVPEGWWFAATCGLVAGVITTLANAAGPVMMLYLLAMKLPRHEFVGTGAWFFLIVNVTKVPLYVAEGMITGPSLLASLAAAPLVAIGALVGVRLLARIPEAWFKGSVIVLSALAALRLLRPVIQAWVG